MNKGNEHGQGKKGQGQGLLEDGAPDVSDVGSYYSLEIQRHANGRLWRLLEREVRADGTSEVHKTKWTTYPEFTPALLMARSRLQQYAVPMGPRIPQRLRPA